ncbi:MAG: cytochrome-c peroxidase [Proteobacteria bacterium]|nr:cytochrome-c peroxidase [Pseudomonadota bacterium]
MGRSVARACRRIGVAAALCIMTAGAVLAAADAGSPTARLPGYGPRTFGDRPSVAQMTAIGERLFVEQALSASGRVSCASCHSPQHAFAAPNARPAQPGGARLASAGRRNPPSLMYLQTTLPFTEHYIDDEDGHGIDAGPTGGFTWDGRVNTLHEQSLIPLFAPHEMANRDARQLARQLQRSPVAADFRRAFSEADKDVFDQPEEVVRWVGAALEVYQQDPATFYPYTSKFDAVMRGQAQFDAAQARGLVLFNDPNKGNCAACHPSGRRSDGGLPAFTDSGYGALGVPRNALLLANRNPRYFDMGLCGPERTDLTDKREYCGFFKVPSLRNVAQHRVFFHNGRFTSLRQVLDFYATRDTDPGRWYPRDAHGRVTRYDDLPPDLRANVNAEVPFEPLPQGKRRLNEAEIDDLLAFLRTLNDGFAVKRTQTGQHSGSCTDQCR